VKVKETTYWMSFGFGAEPSANKGNQNMVRAANFVNFFLCGGKTQSQCLKNITLNIVGMDGFCNLHFYISMLKFFWIIHIYLPLILSVKHDG
jgi:hypothetical protein